MRGTTTPAEPPTESPQAPAENGRHRELLRDLGCGALAGSLALVVAAVVLELWDAKLAIPLSGLGGDKTVSFMAVKMLAAGSWFHNDLIGAPSGTDMQDFPFYWDLGQVLGIKALGLVFSDPARVFNAVYVLSYPVIAFNAFIALRWTGARRGPAVVVAVLYATLPYHFIRGQAHFFIGVYWAVPFSAALVYKLIAGHPLIARRPAGGNVVTRWLSGTTVATLAAAIATGVQFSYYAIFTLILIVLVAAIRFLAVPRRATLIDPLVALLVSGAAFVAMLAPTLLYRLEHGTNALVAHRSPADAELYGLKLVQLLLPIGGHRIGSFDQKAQEYAATAPRGVGGADAALGLLLGMALVVAILSVAVAAVRATPARGQLAVLRASGLGALLCFLLGTIGGGSSLFAYLISSQLRGWTRISILLAFFAAIALTAILTWLLHELRGGRGVAVTGIVLVVVGIAGVLDQTSPKWTPNYAQVFQSWGSDARFVKRIEQRVPHAAKILQLPYWRYPEAPPRARALDYDLFRPMLQSKHLRWSYGAMRGRPGRLGGAVGRGPTTEGGTPEGRRRRICRRLRRHVRLRGWRPGRARGACGRQWRDGDSLRRRANGVRFAGAARRPREDDLLTRRASPCRQGVRPPGGHHLGPRVL